MSSPIYRAILADPANTQLRLVFADWLEEQGHDLWSRFIRVQCQRADPATGDEQRWQLAEEEKAIVRAAAHELQSWGGNVGNLVDEVQFQRGCVERVTVSISDLLHHQEELLASVPLRFLDLCVDGDRLPAARLQASPLLRQIEACALRCGVASVSDGDIQSLGQCPLLLERVRAVSILECNVTPRALGELLDNPCLNQLDELSIWDCPIDALVDRHGQAHQRLFGLSHLALSGCRLDTPFVRSLAHSTRPRKWHHVSFRNCGLQDAEVTDFFRNARAVPLETIDLSHNELRDCFLLDANRGVGDRPWQFLYLHGNSIRESAIWNWLEASMTARIEVVSLSASRLSPLLRNMLSGLNRPRFVFL